MIEEFDAVRSARSSGILDAAKNPPSHSHVCMERSTHVKTLTLPLFRHHLAHAAFEVSYSFKESRYLNFQTVRKHIVWH